MKKYIKILKTRQIFDNSFVMHINIERFTTVMCEKLSIKELLIFLADYKAGIINILKKQNALITIYQGNQIQALWNSEITGRNYISEITGTVKTVSELFNSGFKYKEYNNYKPDIGIASGTVIIHSQEKPFEYFIIGETVNLSRLLSLDRRRFGYTALLNETAGKQIKSSRCIDYYRTPGFTEIFKLYGMETERTPPSDIKNLFELGIHELYIKNNRTDADQIFKDCLKIYPEDTPSKVMSNISESDALPEPRAYRTSC